jgi:hypothetical protein
MNAWQQISDSETPAVRLVDNTNIADGHLISIASKQETEYGLRRENRQASNATRESCSRRAPGRAIWPRSSSRKCSENIVAASYAVKSIADLLFFECFLLITSCGGRMELHPFQS